MVGARCNLHVRLEGLGFGVSGFGVYLGFRASGFGVWGGRGVGVSGFGGCDASAILVLLGLKYAVWGFSLRVSSCAVSDLAKA